MSDLAVTERRLRPIQDAAAARNWKQALQLCDKWHKKGEKSDRFLALKSSILINQPEKAQFEKGKQETLSLCARSTPVTDIEALYQLQSSLKRLSLQNEEGPKLWERAVSATPGDKGLMMTWLNGSLADSNWMMAQKAAMALRKSFPKERQYDFWNILFCYLVQQDASLPDKDKLLFGTLAYRLISKAAEAIPQDNTQVLSSGKAIATTEELALLLRIYLSTSHADEAVALLQSETSGMSSKIAEQDVTMVFSLLLQALSVSSSPTATLEVCQKLIANKDLPVGDLVGDDRIWKVIGDAGWTGSASDREKQLSLIEAALDKNSTCRAIHLAKLRFWMGTWVIEERGAEQLYSTCQRYLEYFSTKPFCFNDLRAELSEIYPEDSQAIIAKASADDASNAEKLFALKVKHSFWTRIEPQPAKTFEFATQAIRLSKSLPEVGNERPEAALIGALALLRLAATVGSFEIAIQACLILEKSYAQHGEYYPLGVRLLQVYRCIGLMSLATRQFISLSIKNMQWETVGHLLMTRVSTLHPIASGHDENSLNPLYALDTALEMLDNMEESLTKAIQKGLGFGNYANVLDTVNLKRDVQHSLNRQIYIIEERRIQNLVGVPVDTVLEPYPTPLVDKRDFSFLDYYGSCDAILKDYLACGGLPAQTWLDVMAFSDHVYQYLRFELAGQTALAAEALEALAKVNTTFDKQFDKAPPDLTDAEFRGLSCRRLICQTFESLRSSVPAQTHIDTNLDHIITWLSSAELAKPDTVSGLKVPGWRYLHSLFSEMEACRLVSLLIELITKKAKSSKGKSPAASKEKVAQLQGAVSEAADAIRSSAKSIKDGINSPGVLSQLIDAAAGRLESGPYSEMPEYKALSEECNALYDEVFLEECCGSMKESWIDAIDGLLAVKIGASK